VVSDNYRSLKDHLSSLQAKIVYRLLDKKEVFMPVSIFSEKSSLLEAIVKYLKEQGLGFADIARLTNRAPSTISTTYLNARHKLKISRQTDISIPVSTIADRRLSTFESIVMYLKYKLDIRLSEISRLLDRDLKVVCKIHNNALRKLDREEFLEYTDRCEKRVLSIYNSNFKDKKEFDKIYTLQIKKLVPVSVLVQNVSPLRAVVSYLKENMTVNEIAAGLNRTKAMVSASYIKPIKVTDLRYRVPLKELGNRRFSIMETVIHHLIEKENLTISEAARVLKRNPSNVSQLYKRYLNKKQ